MLELLYRLLAEFSFSILRQKSLEIELLYLCFSRFVSC